MKRLLAAALSLVLCGCGSQASVRLKVRIAGDERKSPLRNPGTPTMPASDVDTLKLQVYNPAAGVSRENETTNDFSISDSIKIGALDVMAGPGWHAELTGADRFMALYAMGRSLQFTVEASASVEVPIVLGIADDFATSAVVKGGIGPFASASALSDGSAALVGLGGVKLHEPRTGRVCDDCLTGDVPSPRFMHAAVRLADGKVFIAGGAGPTGAALDDTAVLDGSTKSFARLRVEGFPARVGTAAALLGSGKVLFAGGRGAMAADSERVVLVDPANGTMTEAPRLMAGVMLATATALADGTVLVAGGLDAMGEPVNRAYVYSADGMTATPVTMLGARGAHTATLLSDGYVLLFGGRGAMGALLSSAEAFTPAAKFIAVDTPNVEGRAGHTALRLDNDAVLIVGGHAEPVGPVDPARLVPALRFTPERETGGKYLGTFVPLGQVVTRSGAAMTVLPDLSVLVAGGARPALAADPATPADAADWVEYVELFTPCAIKGRACPR